MRSVFRFVVLFCAVSTIGASGAAAADWPGWRGPNRDGASREIGLLREWPQQGPTLIWKTDLLGVGYSGVSVLGDRIFTMGNGYTKGPPDEPWVKGKNREWVMAFDANSGEQVWASATAMMDFAGGGTPGPRSTPFADGDRLYTLGLNGDLVCMSTGNGKVIWQKNLVKDFGGKIPQYGYSESVLVDGSTVLCTPGGKDATMVALQKTDGEVIWKCPAGDDAAYSSIISYKGSGQAQYVTLTAGGVIGVNAADGKLLWRFKKLAGTSQMVNIPTCLAWGRTIFGANGSAGGACFWWQPSDGQEAKQIYLTNKMKNFMGGFVLLSFAEDAYLFGCSEPGYLVCLDYKKGSTKWHTRETGKCSTIYADGMLYCRNENGTVYLVQATYSGFKLKGKLEQPDRTDKKAFTPPVVANGRLYLRDQWNLFCYDLTGEAKPLPSASGGEGPAEKPAGEEPGEKPAEKPAEKPPAKKPPTKKPAAEKTPKGTQPGGTTPGSTPKFRPRGTGGSSRPPAKKPETPGFY